MSPKQIDVLIIGAGPSGSVAAAMVQQAGLHALIVEKQQFPRFVIGESLLPRCMEPLAEANLIEAIERKGFQKKHGARFIIRDEICDFDFSQQFSQGWNWTWQVPRADFDKTLADEVESRGVEILYKHSVVDIAFDGSDSQTTIEDSEGKKIKVNAKFVIDASGYGRVLPRLLGLDQPSGMPGRTAMFAHIQKPAQSHFHTEDKISIIIVTEGVWAWNIPFSNGNASIGFVGDPSYFDTFTGNPEERFRQMLQATEVFKDAYQDSSFIFEPQTIKGYSASVSKLCGEGFALTGNSADFLDPVFSSGVTFALESGCLAGKMAARQIKGETLDWDAEFATHMKQGVDTFRSYVNGWYDGTLPDIFFSPQEGFNTKTRNQICSVLAGYVWDKNNPYVNRHSKAIHSLSKVIKILNAVD